MGIYIGYVEKKGFEPTVFYNFAPIAEIKGNKLMDLSPYDLDELLPESEKRDINFGYSWNDNHDSEMMSKMFTNHSLVIFEFIQEDLQPNISKNGERNPTGYRIQAPDMIIAGKIRKIDKENIYTVIEENEIVSDFTNDTIVEIDKPSVLAGDKVFVEYKGYLAGPYEVRYREYTSSYYIKPQIKENKYTLTGYKKSDVTHKELIVYEEYWSDNVKRFYVVIPENKELSVQIDVISKEILLESFKDSLKQNSYINGNISLDNIPELVKDYENSVLAGSELSEDIRQSRLKQLREIITAEADIDSTLKVFSEIICDLLIKYQDSPDVEEWLKQLLDKHPDFMDRMKSTRVVSEQIAQMEHRLSELNAEYENLLKDVTEKHTDDKTVVHSAIEEKKTELISMDSEYLELCDKIEVAKKTYGEFVELEKIIKKHEDVQHKINFLEEHKKHLERETKEIENQFQNIIDHSHEKMVDIAFDGFMSSKMMDAAARWEKTQESEVHTETVNKVNEIEINEKSPDELIEYLCDEVKSVRPSYDRNTIINFAICLSQGFLTVLSGEPGCGKTSICNIFAHILGLNKLEEKTGISSVNRYVPVSVERGWTSKRDFVGYYNPLSKTFDKSNRRVYDALHFLDSEKKENFLRLPYIILLDEANLSPMEYYWSDFMNICDDLGPYSNVNLGENYIFGIPETLHFLATINNDHTTEILSPRLIDRAWIVSLPQQNSQVFSERTFCEKDIEIISWNSLKKAFVPDEEECVFTYEIQRIYDSVVAKLKEKRFFVSPRIERAIKHYWAAASKHFEMDETKTNKNTIALDYAISQRILPKISGNGENFESWLEELRSLCSSSDLNISAKILKDIIERGNQQMKYYQFFC